jgi:uncharacterized delta-60 repeat protein
MNDYPDTANLGPRETRLPITEHHARMLPTSGAPSAISAAAAGSKHPRNFVVAAVCVFIFIAASLIATLARAQTVNDGFDPNATGGDVFAALVQPDGKVLLGGYFSAMKGAPRKGIARVNVDGSNDANFDPGSGIAAVDGYVRVIARQSDGRIYVGGSFQSINGRVRYNLARLLENGAVDNAFNPAAEINGAVNAIVIQPDGKVIIGGAFTEAFREPRLRVARLNTNGSLDTSFNPGTSAPGYVFAIALQADGKLLVGGEGALERGSLIRLNGDGSRDLSFQLPPITGRVAGVYELAIQPDGKVLMGGSFSAIGTVNTEGIARVNADGNIDTTFAAVNLVLAVVSGMALQPDGRIVIGGSFDEVNGVVRSGVARLNPDGTLDSSYAVITMAGGVNTVALQPDGGVVAAGYFTAVNGVTRSRVARFDAMGNLDRNLIDVGGGVNNSVYALASAADGVAIGGRFTDAAIAYNSYGKFITTSRATIGFDVNGPVRAVAIDTDNRVLLGGEFTATVIPPSSSIGRLARFNLSSQTHDPVFNANIGAGFNGTVNAIAIQPDKKILVGGNFTQFKGTAHNGILRLKEDGTLDSTFVSPTSFGRISTIALQPDGKILIGGGSNIARLNANGSNDTLFTSGASNGFIFAIAVQLDGKILVGGLFSTYNGLPTINLGRLHYDGTRDTSFNVGTTGPNGAVLSIVIQARGSNIDGSIIIGGQFTQVDGNARNRLARLNNAGAVDPSFNANPAGGPNASVLALALQPDGKLLIGGDFNDYDGALRSSIARISTSQPALYNWSLIPTGGTDPNRYFVAWAPGIAAPVFSAVEFDYSTDFNTWSPLGSAFRGPVQWSAEVTVPKGRNFWIRARARIPGGLGGGSSGVFEQIKQFYEPIVVPVSNDLDGNSKSDLLFRNTSTGQISAWLMNGSTATSTAGLVSPGAWTITHTADFNNDGKSDLLFRNDDGSVTLWLMNGLSVMSSAGLIGPDPNWRVTHVGDFNGDGKADILWRNTNGAVTLWLMDGTTILSSAGLIGADPNWSVSHVADFNGDGKADLLWRNTNGSVTQWLMFGTSVANATALLGPDPSWSVTHTADLNGDGKADLLWRNTNGTVIAWLMNGTAVASTAGLLGADPNWRITHVGDFNGDGKSDILWRNTNGSVTQWLMFGTSIANATSLLGPDPNWSVTHLGDFNGDGKADLVWRNTTDGSITMWLMNGTATTSTAGILGPSPWVIVPPMP